VLCSLLLGKDYTSFVKASAERSVVNGKLHGHGSLSPIYTNTNFPSDRLVQSELRTETAGGAPYDVAVLMIKWVNMQNQINVRIFTDGTIDLIMWKNGNQAFGTTVSSTLSPYVSHMFTANVTGTNIKVWIDGSLRINVNSAYFDDIAGTVGYQAVAKDFPVSAEVSMQPRNGSLYPHWEIYLPLDKLYLGQVTSVRVMMWADTGEIDSFEASSTLGDPSSQDTTTPSALPSPQVTETSESTISPSLTPQPTASPSPSLQPTQSPSSQPENNTQGFSTALMVAVVAAVAVVIALSALLLKRRTR
jgi:hypothetical protein